MTVSVASTTIGVIGSRDKMRGQKEVRKLIAILFLAFASGCVASDIRYRPCHDLGTDMSVSANDYYSQCPMRDRGT